MALKAFNPSLFNPFLLWADVALKTTEMLFSSAQVIGTRVNRMALAGANPSARDRREFALMGTEKVKAATESGLAVAARLQAANWQLCARAWQQWLASSGNAARLAGAALKPVHAASTANARRLARVGTRSRSKR